MTEPNEPSATRVYIVLLYDNYGDLLRIDGVYATRSEAEAEAEAFGDITAEIEEHEVQQ